MSFFLSSLLSGIICNQSSLCCKDEFQVPFHCLEYSANDSLCATKMSSFLSSLLSGIICNQSLACHK
eukprot:5924000-Ditylum_brightwellii.AAC.1